MLRRLAVAILALAGVVSATGPADTLRQHAKLARDLRFETREKPNFRVNERASKSKYYNSNTSSTSPVKSCLFTQLTRYRILGQWEEDPGCKFRCRRVVRGAHAHLEE